jgi:hypothetical protein
LPWGCLLGELWKVVEDFMGGKKLFEEKRFPCQSFSFNMVAGKRGRSQGPKWMARK